MCVGADPVLNDHSGSVGVLCSCDVACVVSDVGALAGVVGLCSSCGNIDRYEVPEVKVVVPPGVELVSGPIGGHLVNAVSTLMSL